VLLCVLFVCKCVLYYCYQVSTLLQLANISINIKADRQLSSDTNCNFTKSSIKCNVSQTSCNNVQWLNNNCIRHPRPFLTLWVRVSAYMKHRSHFKNSYFYTSVQVTIILFKASPNLAKLGGMPFDMACFVRPAVGNEGRNSSSDTQRGHARCHVGSCMTRYLWCWF